VSKTVLVSIYAHPEGYPPTLNCIEQLSGFYENVILLGRNVQRKAWNYPENCEVFFSSQYIDGRQADNKSLVRKIIFFINFLKLLLTKAIKNKPELILVYDPMALFAYSLIRKFLNFPHRVWYHNHDVLNLTDVRKFSVQWWAGKYEGIAFKWLDIFSLPSEERKQHFPINKLKGKYFLIPNFPSRSFLGKFYKSKEIKNIIKIIYQGAIAEGHGFEEIMSILNHSINGKSLELTLIGIIHKPYREHLNALAIKYNCLDKFKIEPFKPYKELPAITAVHHIGIGIYALNSNFHLSLGKASNKIYEYACLGLPILVYDNNHYREHIGMYPWVKFTDLSQRSLIECIQSIVENYEILSKKAHGDFNAQLNFEVQFDEVKQYLNQLPSLHSVK